MGWCPEMYKDTTLGRIGLQYPDQKDFWISPVPYNSLGLKCSCMARLSGRPSGTKPPSWTKKVLGRWLSSLPTDKCKTLLQELWYEQFLIKASRTLLEVDTTQQKRQNWAEITLLAIVSCSTRKTIARGFLFFLRVRCESLVEKWDLRP